MRVTSMGITTVYWNSFRVHPRLMLDAVDERLLAFEKLGDKLTAKNGGVKT
ncbi:MAG: hypothetical protein ACK5XP_01360 [Sphingobacteriia bacterium]|jgi:hypothetical protein